MIDGPFKYIKLSNHQKRLLRELPNSAVSDEECADLAENVLEKELEKTENKRFLNNLVAMSKIAQWSLFPEVSLENLISMNPNSNLITEVQRNVKLRLSKSEQFGANIEGIVSEAIEISKSQQIKLLEKRVDDECVRQREILGVKDKVVGRARERNKRIWEIVKNRRRSDSTDTTRPRYGEMTGLEHGPRL